MKKTALALLASCSFLALGARAECLDSLLEVKAAAWRDRVSQPVLSRMKKHSGPPDRITIHYTGVRKNPRVKIEDKLRNLFYFSVKEKTRFKKDVWGDVPYHVYIDMHGVAAEARATDYRPDTNTDYDPDRHVTVVVEALNEKISDEQKSKLFAVVEALQDKFGIETARIDVHNHYADTTCPGKDLVRLVAEYKKTHVEYKPQTRSCGYERSSP